jgi:lambda repressor-like predicted transcriptional regulator
MSAHLVDRVLSMMHRKGLTKKAASISSGVPFGTLKNVLNLDQDAGPKVRQKLETWLEAQS